MYNQRFEDFLEAAHSAANIDDQNARFDRIEEELQDPAFQELAFAGIKDEQRDTMEALRYRTESLPWHKLHQVGQSLEGELHEASERLEKITDEDDAVKTRLFEMAQKVAELAPYSKTAAEELALERVASIDTLNREALRKRIDLIKAELSEYNAAFEEVGAAWSLPKAYHLETKAPDETWFEDEIPVEPAIITQSAAMLDRLCKHEVDAPEASLWIATYLASQAGETVTVEELVDWVYWAVESERTNRHLRTRITTALGPKIQGERIRKMLRAEDYELQYGWRKQYTRDAQGMEKANASRPHRIYRAVRIGSTQIDTSKEFHERVIDVLSPSGSLTERIIESLDVEVDEQFDDSTRVLGSIVLKAVELAAAREAIPSPLDIKRLLDTRRAAHESAAALPAAAILEQPLAGASNTKKPAEQKRPSRPVIPATPERREPWQKAFMKTVGQHIEILHKDGLMKQEAMPYSIVGVMSGSNRLATKTAVERLVQAKLMTEAEAASGTLNARQLVLSSLYNGNKALFTAKSRRKEALAIVDQAIAGYFQHQEKQENK